LKRTLTYFENPIAYFIIFGHFILLPQLHFERFMLMRLYAILLSRLDLVLGLLGFLVIVIRSMVTEIHIQVLGEAMTKIKAKENKKGVLRQLSGENSSSFQVRIVVVFR
jgi:hypothetical protein